jgi:hypothetical protein
MTKRFISISTAAEDPDVPWNDAREIYNVLQRIKPIRDSRGNIANAGDPELLSAFLRIAQGDKSPLRLDKIRLNQVLEKRRLSEGDL